MVSNSSNFRSIIFLFSVDFKKSLGFSNKIAFVFKKSRDVFRHVYYGKFETPFFYPKIEFFKKIKKIKKNLKNLQISSLAFEAKSLIFPKALDFQIKRLQIPFFLKGNL